MKEAEKLFKEYDDDPSAHMLYSKALFLFRKEGDTARAEEAFWDAVDENGHVIDMMIGLTPLPDSVSDSYAPGSIEEAHSYILNGIRSWVKTKGAVEWTADLISREEEREKLDQTFPGLLDATPKNNVIDLKTFKLR